MSLINDTGKVWIPGKFAPEFAVRVGDSFFVTGGEEGQAAHYWSDGRYLYVDLHDAGKKSRALRRFDLGLVPQTGAALFSGFEATPHGDVRVVTPLDLGVEQHILTGADYAANAAMPSAAVFRLFFPSAGAMDKL